jgi:hypothetical protein
MKKDLDNEINSELIKIRDLRMEINLLKKELANSNQKSTDMPLDIPFVPSSHEKTAIMLSLAGNVKNKKTADLGSGDGRVVVKFAQAGAFAHGFEVNPERAAAGQKKILENKLGDRAEIFQKNFWDAELSDYDVITVYGITSVMQRLENKILAEGKNGLRVISNTFIFPHWKPNQENEKIFLYIKND